MYKICLVLVGVQCQWIWDNSLLLDQKRQNFRIMNIADKKWVGKNREKKIKYYKHGTVFAVGWVGWKTSVIPLAPLAKIEAQYRVLAAGSQEICQWTVRSWSLGNPSRKIIQGAGEKIYLYSFVHFHCIHSVIKKIYFS